MTEATGKTVTRMNSLKSFANNCGPLSEMMRGETPENFSGFAE
jgi:hypothetical protein